MPDDLLRMLEEMDANATEAAWGGAAGGEFIWGGLTDQWVVGEDAPISAADLWAATALRNSLPALLDVLRAADAIRAWTSGREERWRLQHAREAYDAARARFAQAIKEGKG